MTLAVQNHHDIAVDADAMGWPIRGGPKVGRTRGRRARGRQRRRFRRSGAERKRLPVNTIRPPTTSGSPARTQNELTNYGSRRDVIRAVPIFGKGFVDYRAFFRALRAGGYRGFVAYEMCEVLDGAVDPETSNCRQFLTYIKQFEQPVLAR